MSEATRILSQIEDGDGQAAEKLLPLVYDELRRLAAQKMAQEKPGQTLQATALVHEAYIRLVNVGKTQTWDSRRHFFAAAAESMRRILVDRARQKNSRKRGGDLHREEAVPDITAPETDDGRWLAIDDALISLAEEDPQAADLVKLRYFAGFSITQAADILGLSRSTAYEQWSYARAWLQCALANDE